MVNEKGLWSEGEGLQEDESVHSFVKIKLVGKLSSISTPELTDVIPKESSKVDQAAELEALSPRPEKEITSVSTQPGTPRTSVKTFKTRSAQTVQSDNQNLEILKPKVIPAKFEGTMLTPVFFDGFMMTPQSLDHILSEASKKHEGISIPIKLHGGMLTAAFKTMTESPETGETNVPIPVKFNGRLQGVMESNVDGVGMPVAFEGNMVRASVK